MLQKKNIIGAQIARRIIKISLEQYFMVDYSRTANDQIESIWSERGGMIWTSTISF